MRPPALAGLPPVAYFSMEIHLEDPIPTYSGGLGVLAGDTLRAAADLGLPMVGLTLAHRQGYFRQRLDEWGNQTESPAAWDLAQEAEPTEGRASVMLAGRPVALRAWRYLIRGAFGHSVPVYLLDANLPENQESDRALTDHLYGGDERYRLCQEAILGLGGVEILRKLEPGTDFIYHMNEGHAALLSLALLEAQAGGEGPEAVEAVRRQCVFTTHTPVPAGHDRFPAELAREVLGAERMAGLEHIGCCPDSALNLTYLALYFSRYINGVALRHGAVSKGMFPNYPINSITNGVHAATWTAPPFAELYDRRIPEWRHDNNYLRYAIGISREEIQSAHRQAKLDLLDEVKARTGSQLDESVFTLGFARRATTYKRADLLFLDQERLRRIARQAGPLQIIYGGKAHPRDEGGKEIIRRVFRASAELKGAVPVVYLENYDAAFARRLCAGVDLWLNTPLPPQEASGTSGMKAALNGVPSLSVLDGWWVEGHIEGVTGWAIGEDTEASANSGAELASLYDQLEQVILPLFYQQPAGYADIMRRAISLNGAFFNTQRMLIQYLRNAYRIKAPPPGPAPSGEPEADSGPANRPPFSG